MKVIGCQRKFFIAQEVRENNIFRLPHGIDYYIRIFDKQKLLDGCDDDIPVMNLRDHSVEWITRSAEVVIYEAEIAIK